MTGFDTNGVDKFEFTIGVLVRAENVLFLTGLKLRLS
jgi:hypothetical protein